MSITDTQIALKKKLQETNSPWERLPILIALTKELNQKDPANVHQYAVEAYTIAKELNDPFWIATSLYATCLHLMKTAEYAQAIPILEKASEIFAQINELRMKAETDTTIAKTYTLMGEYPRALKLLLQNLSFFRNIDSPLWVVHTLLAIGDIYRLTGAWEKGLKYYRQGGKIIEGASLKPEAANLYLRIAASYRMMEDSERYRAYMFKSLVVSKQIGNKAGIAIAIGNIGNSYLDQERFSEAENYVKLSGRLYHELGYVTYEAMSWARLASIYEHREETEKAYRYFRKGIRLIRQCGDALIRGQIYEHFGGLCVRMGRTEQGFRYLRKALELIGKTGNPNHLHKAYEKLALACEQSGDPKEALEHYKEAARIKQEYINSQKIMKASYTELKARMAPIIRQLKEEQAKNSTLKRMIEQREAELLSLTLGMIQDEEEQSTTKRRGPAKRSESARGNRIDGLSKNWDTFTRQFHKVHHEFYSNLLRKFPELTLTETKVCSLIRIGLSSKEIAGVLCISQRTVESHRMRVHRKMELPSGSSLTKFIARL